MNNPHKCTDAASTFGIYAAAVILMLHILRQIRSRRFSVVKYYAKQDNLAELASFVVAGGNKVVIG